MTINGVTHTGRNLYTTTERIVEAKNATTIHFTIFLISLKGFTFSTFDLNFVDFCHDSA